MGKSIKVTITPEQEKLLMAIQAKGTTEKRLWQRAEIILRSAAGESAVSIARLFGIQPHVITKWRHRFLESGVDGLSDMPRPGAPRKIDERLEERILAILDKEPPKAYSRWNGRLIAEQLGDVTAAQVWTVMRRHGIDLERRRSWCISTDPEFTSKAADIVGLYLNPPENAVVVCMDEKPCIQAIERTQGYLRFSDKKTMLGFSDRYVRHGCTTLFAALEVATGEVIHSLRARKRRREFLDFMNELVDAYPDKELHVVLDNLSTHRKKGERWLLSHPHVHFHYTPTNASWLNQVEVFFSILQRAALDGGSFTSVPCLRGAIRRFISGCNEAAQPFEWKKTCVYPKKLPPKKLTRINLIKY